METRDNVTCCATHRGDPDTSCPDCCAVFNAFKNHDRSVLRHPNIPTQCPTCNAYLKQLGENRCARRSSVYRNTSYEISGRRRPKAIATFIDSEERLFRVHAKNILDRHIQAGTFEELAKTIEAGCKAQANAPSCSDVLDKCKDLGNEDNREAVIEWLVSIILGNVTYRDWETFNSMFRAGIPAITSHAKALYAVPPLAWIIAVILALAEQRRLTEKQHTAANKATAILPTATLLIVASILAPRAPQGYPASGYSNRAVAAREHCSA
ncbi:hypothetical protein G1C97_1826 [Bifidobacterium sp. DSM 109959]|uniref:Uncharacterized protein n=1 Tax=Bifidobacterium olomucense TaxID=2675324 RepID=A0A7Y0HXN2_9BIFI|nr:hypothetical protein [Bifidobacterium sp. DSM 109959]